MNKEQFTPGPWEIRRNAIFIPDTTRSVATIHVVDNWDQLSGQPKLDHEQTANANLIAAAPDMYEALKKAIHTIELLADELNYTSQRWQSEHLDPLQIALNKANKIN